MEKSKQTFSELLSFVDQQNLPSASHSPPQTPPAAFTCSPQNITTTSSLNPLSKIEPYSCSPPKSFTTSAPVKAQTFDELINIKPKQSFSNELRKSIRLSSKPSKVSYIDLENESETFTQAQNPAKRLKQHSSAFSPYDRKTAQKEKMLDEIFSESIDTKEKVLVNPYSENDVLESTIKRPLSETIGWKEFCEIDEVIYTDLVQNFYSSATVLEGHEVIICQMNQTNIYITTDILAKVFNIPNSGVKLFGRKWYDEVKPKLNRNTILSNMFDKVTLGKDFPVTDLKNEFKILHNLCSHCILPRSKCKYRVNNTDIMILYHLTHGKRINLPYVIIQHMMNAIASNNGNDGLPYAMPLTKIFKEFKMSFIGEVAKRNLKYFTSKNVSHIKRRKSSSQSAPSNSHGSQNHELANLFALNVSTDLKLSTGLDNSSAPIISAPLPNVENSALFGTSCLNKFIHSPKNDTLPLSEMPQIPSHFSSFGSFKSTRTSSKNDPPQEPENSVISNEMLFAEVTSLRGDVNNLRECFVSFMFQYLGMMAPVPGGDPGSSSNPPPNPL
ncbi:hypothetical protein MTR_5g006000 [Medicago truncatula]|uniref:Putative plant transposon protein domain-containing protein n=1 Tax=Medicago truncatula TaxID=3880 RepID=G7K2B9_MEDTR|nr:hypothetical protein MTR_5g006000 [Medicago truncatula]